MFLELFLQLFFGNVLQLFFGNLLTESVKSGIIIALIKVRRQFQRFSQSCHFDLQTHNGATILHPNTKVLDFQGLFVFL